MTLYIEDDFTVEVDAGTVTARLRVICDRDGGNAVGEFKHGTFEANDGGQYAISREAFAELLPAGQVQEWAWAKAGEAIEARRNSYVDRKDEE